MQLLVSEQVLFRLDTGDGQLVLTTQRVYHSNKSGFTNIMLQDVCSVAMARTAHGWLVWAMAGCVALAACLVWMAIQADTAVREDDYRRIASAFLFLGAFLMSAFHLTRFSKMQIASPGASIELRVRTMINKEMRHFVREMETAKNARYLEGDRLPPTPAAVDAPAQNVSPAPQRRLG